MKHLTNSLLGIIIVLQLASIAMIYKLQHSHNTSDNVTIEPAKAEPSPFDNVSQDPYYNVSDEAQGPISSIQFDRKEHDFGTIKEDVLSNTTFRFTNTGKEDLFISNAVGSCGCTVPEWPKEPIKPGTSAEIKVQFDSKDKVGEQLKTVTVSSNTQPSNTVLTIKAIVKAKQ